VGPGPVWTDGKSRPHRDSIPELPTRSSVDIPTELPGPYIYMSDSLGLDDPGGGPEFPHLSRPAVKSTQPPIQRLPGLFPAVKWPGRDVDHSSHLALRLKKE